MATIEVVSIEGEDCQQRAHIRIKCRLVGPSPETFKDWLGIDTAGVRNQTFGGTRHGVPVTRAGYILTLSPPRENSTPATGRAAGALREYFMVGYASFSSDPLDAVYIQCFKPFDDLDVIDVAAYACANAVSLYVEHLVERMTETWPSKQTPTKHWYRTNGQGPWIPARGFSWVDPEFEDDENFEIDDGDPEALEVERDEPATKKITRPHRVPPDRERAIREGVEKGLSDAGIAKRFRTGTLNRSVIAKDRKALGIPALYDRGGRPKSAEP